MAFLCLGLALLAMKLAEFGSVAAWSWWVVLLPFGLATAWWAFADGIGLTQRRAMGKMEAKKTERRNRNLDALGLGPRRDVKARRDSRFNTAATGRHAAKDPTMAAAEEVGRR